jgi:Pyruvate/2-oxoacid:ferredoxin oxidoreductase delta subunit
MPEPTVYQQIATRLGADPQGLLPEILQVLADENQARILLAASPPATAAELADKTGLSPEQMPPLMDDLFTKGLIFKSKKPDATRYYSVRHVPQMHDATCVMQDPPPRMLELWRRYMATEWGAYLNMIESVLDRPASRVIPIEASVEPEMQVLAFEDVKRVLDHAHNLAVTRCSCRVIDGSCGMPLEVCIQVGKAADYAIERGTGRQITREQALAIMRECEDKGLVHCSDNKRAVGLVICNCCRDCCMNWTSLRQATGKFLAPSRFRAEVEADECTACEDCVERCFFEAISMQGKDGAAVIDADKCMGCGLCAPSCPIECIHLRAVRPEEFVPA